MDSTLSISVTGVMDILKSPMHYKAFHIDKLREPSKSMEEGTALHYAVFEPKKFETEVYVNYECPPDYELLRLVDDFKNYLKDKGLPVSGKKEELVARVLEHRGNDKVLTEGEVEALYQDKIRLTETQHQNIIRIRDNALKNKLLAYYRQSGEAKVEQYMKGEIKGVEIRGRLDWMALNKNLNRYIIVDLKKCASAQFRDFQRNMAYMNYHVQAYLYSELVKQNFESESLYAWLACETALPHVCEMYACDEGTLEAGKQITEYAIEVYKECMKTDFWPGYSTGDIQNINLPNWAFDEIANKIL